MKTNLKTNTLREAINKRLNSNAATVIGLLTLFGMGFTVGTYYEKVVSNKEIAEINNKHTLELIELRNKQTIELIQLQREITLLNLKNEKEK